MDLHPWDYWLKDGTPQPWTEELLTTLENVIKKNPDHHGANHLYIHADLKHQKILNVEFQVLTN